jgi:hypothetical protein
LLTRRIWLRVALLSLPAVALIAWRGIVALDLRRIPPARWNLEARDRICYGDRDLVGTRPGDPPPERVSETPPGTLPADRAALIAWHVIRKHTNVQPFQGSSYGFLYGEGPTLVQATFPDGERRLAWRRTLLIGQDDMGMSGVAAAVYLDAATGEPLALVRDIYVCEPSWSPLFMSSSIEYNLSVWLQTFGQFVLLGLYIAIALLVVGVIFGVRWLRARRRRRAQGRDAPASS